MSFLLFMMLIMIVVFGIPWATALFYVLMIAGAFWALVIAVVAGHKGDLGYREDKGV